MRLRTSAIALIFFAGTSSIPLISEAVGIISKPPSGKFSLQRDNISQSTSIVYPDVTPNDYFFAALQSLVERHGVLGGSRGNFNGYSVMDKTEANEIAGMGYLKISEIGNAYCSEHGKRFVVSRSRIVGYLLKGISQKPDMTRGEFAVDLNSSLDNLQESLSSNLPKMCR